MKNGFLHFMPASLEEEGYFGYKAYTSFKGAARFVVFLFDNEDGALRAMIEGDRLGQLRTGAASAVVTRILAREDAVSFGLIGSGYQAETQLEGALAMRKFSGVTVFSRNYDHAERFCEEFGKKSGVEIKPVKSVEDAASADVITTVTSATSPVLFAEAVKPGSHINAVGGNMLVRRELDEKVVESANLIVIDSVEQGKEECGDFLPLLEKGRLHWDEVYEYKDLFTGTVARKSASEITLFKSQGIGAWDVALAKVVFERARDQKLGRQISL